MGLRIVVALIALGLVAAAVTVVVFQGWEGADTVTATGRPTDDFDQPDGAPVDSDWTAVRGRWATLFGRARTLEPTDAEQPALLTMDRPEADGVVAVSLGQVAY